MVVIDIEIFNSECKSCGGVEFEIKNEQGITYQHCTHCGRDRFVEQIPQKEIPPVSELPIIISKMEIITVSGESAILENIPCGNKGDELKRLYLLKPDGCIDKSFKAGQIATADKFSYDVSTRSITFPITSQIGDKYMIYYEFQIN